MSDTRHLPFTEAIPESFLSDLLQKEYGFKPSAIRALGGYTNRNFSIQSPDNQEFVLRIARSNRSLESISAEQHVLKTLEQLNFELAPRLVEPLNQKPATIQLDTERFVQLSHRLPGTIACLWWQQFSFERLTQTFTALACLHKLMAQIPLLGPGGAPNTIDHAAPALHPETISSRSPLNPFHYNLPNLPPAALNITPVGAFVFDQWPRFRQSALRIQRDAANRFPWEKAGYQWIHGDIQLENLLFEQDRFTGFLDFERVSIASSQLDAIFSAFRVCKEGNSDGPFSYDRPRLEASLAAYRTENPADSTPFFTDYEKYWKPLFCLDQAMVYLENAFDGIWQLAEGIGFLPCFNEVLSYPAD